MRRSSRCNSCLLLGLFFEGIQQELILQAPGRVPTGRAGDGNWRSRTLVLQQFDRRSVVFDKSRNDARCSLERPHQNIASTQRCSKIAHFKCNVRNATDQLRVVRLNFVSCPLNPVQAGARPAHEHILPGQISLARASFKCGNVKGVGSER